MQLNTQRQYSSCLDIQKKKNRKKELQNLGAQESIQQNQIVVQNDRNTNVKELRIQCQHFNTSKIIKFVTKIIPMQMLENAKPQTRSVFEMIKSFFFPKEKAWQSKVKDIEQCETSKNQNEKKPSIIEFKERSSLSKPELLSSILDVQYLQDASSWRQILSDGFLFGIINNPEISVTQNSRKNFWLQISKASEINNLASMRPYCFDLIFSGSHDQAMLKQIFKSHQRVLLRAKSDEELKQIIKIWQKVIENEGLRKSVALKYALHKLSVKVRILNREYIIFLNQMNQQKLQRTLQQFDILKNKKQDALIIQRMKDSLTFKEYFQLKHLQRQGNLQRHTLIRFLLDRYLISQDELVMDSPSLPASSPKIFQERFFHNKNNLRNDGNHQSRSAQFEMEIDYIKKIPSMKHNSSEEDQNLFNLHLIDRYEFVQGEEERTLRMGSSQKTKRYRTKSCCVESIQNDGQSRIAYERQNFILDI